ncbi:MAG: CD1247 N-terminal domain-containing protein [Bacillota bacterium]
MADLKARVSYLKGLLSGFGTDNGARDRRFSEEIINVLNDLAEEVEDLRSAQEGLEEYIQALDEDLYAVETMVFGDEDEELRIDTDIDNEMNDPWREEIVMKPDNSASEGGDIRRNDDAF